MRYGPYDSHHRSRFGSQFTLRGLIFAVLVLALLLQVRAYAAALLVFITGVVAILTDWLATMFRLEPGRHDRLRHQLGVAVIRRFWYRAWTPPNKWIASVPVVVAIVYLGCFALWHWTMTMMLRAHRDFFDETNDLGISLRQMDHALNATVLAYLAANFYCSLFPHSFAQRNDRIPLIVAMIIVAVTHFAIY